MVEYLGISGLSLFLISSLIVVKVSLERRPTYKEVQESQEEFQNKDLCQAIHKSVDEKLSCLPTMKEDLVEIKTKLDILVSNGNNKKKKKRG